MPCCPKGLIYIKANFFLSLVQHLFKGFFDLKAKLKHSCIYKYIYKRYNICDIILYKKYLKPTLNKWICYAMLSK